MNTRQTAKSLTAACLLMVMNIFSGHTRDCQKDEYKIGSECCRMCPAGSRVDKDCIKMENTTCLLCSEGTYMNQPTARRQCFTCKVCDAGSGLTTKTSCTTTSDTVCERQEGFYCVEPSDNGCDAAKKHRRCEPGQYISKNGTASSDTECSDCSHGTFSDGSFTSCRPHTQCDTENLQLLEPGTASADAQCGEKQMSPLLILLFASLVMFVIFLLLCCGLAFWKVKSSLFKPGQKQVQAVLQNTTNEAEEETML